MLKTWSGIRLTLAQDRRIGSRRPVLLALGFTALILIIGVSAFSVWQNARNAQARVAALHESHTRAGTALGAIRANAYLIGVLTRDYLLDQDASQAQTYIDQLGRIRKATEEQFTELQSSAADDEQKAALRNLRSEFEEYWDPTEIALDWSPAEKRAQRAQVLRERVRRREEVMALAAQVEQLITTNFLRERQRITSAEGEFRASLGWTAGLALLLGVIIAGVTFARMIELEHQSVVAESELRRLSGQLRTAQEQERRNLSRELHDQVGQLLTGLRMELASIARISGDTEGELSAKIALAKGTVEQTLRVVRNIAMLLRPSMLDDLGLTPALQWLVKEMSRSSGIEITAEVDAALDCLPDAHRTCLYRVIQEALTNATRHSGGSKIEVTLRFSNGWVTGTIADNGRGFGPSTGTQKGLGLIGMEERARELGGSIGIESRRGRGTRIEVRLPSPVTPRRSNDQDPDCGRPRDRSHRLETSA